MIIVGACDFQLLEPPELPRWGFSLTVPLINMTYNLSELAESDTTISQDTTSKELQIEFSGTLDTTKIDSSLLEVELPAEASRIDINESVNGIKADDFFSPVSEEIQVTLELDSLLRKFNPILFGSVEFPAGDTLPILESVWNDNVAGQSLDSEEDFEVFDAALALQDNAFIKAIRYVQLSNTATSEFITRVGTPDFPTNVDSILIEASSGSYFNVVHDTTTLPPDGIFYRVSNLQSDSLGSDIVLALRLEMPAVTGDVIIPAGDDPRIEFTITITVGGLDSLAITTAETSLIEDPPEPLPLPSDIQISRGQLRDPVTAPINRISIADLGTSLPFDIRFQLSFPNFDSLGLGTDMLTLGPYTLREGEPLVSEQRSVAGYTFYNPSDDGPISQFEYDLVVDILEKDVVLPLDGSSLGEFNASLGIGVDLDDPSDGKGDLHFDRITGNFSLSFDAVNTTIQDIPTGFAGFRFGRLSLALLLRNQIDLPVQLDLRLVGKTFEGDSVAIPINAPINYPKASGTDSDIAYTMIILDESSVRTYWFPGEDADTSIAWWDTTVVSGGKTIVDVLNLPPDIIKVAGAATVEDTGIVEVGKGIWGEFELIAPFAFILPLDISFLPVAPIPLAPMDEETHEQIQTALLSASLTSTVQTKFPIGGKISMLASDTTLFTLALDYLDDIAAGFPKAARTGDATVYTTIQAVLEADSIMGVNQIVFYPEKATAEQTTSPLDTRAKKVEFYTAQGDSFWIGHLFDIELPPPSAFTEEGWVDTGGYAKQEIILDAERVGWIASDTTVYLKTFITLYNTSGIDSVRTIQSTNSIHFSAFITFNLASDILGEEEEPDSSEIEVTPIPDMTLVLASTDTVYLDSVFVPPAGKKIKDLDLAATTSHEGIAKGTIKTLRTGGIRKYLLVTPVSPGTARITVSADDDPEDDIDPATASFLVTVQEANGESTPPVPSIHKVARHNRLW